MAWSHRTGSLIEDYRVETVTLKVGLDGKVGVAFIGDAEIEAGIELEIKRINK